MDYCELYTYWIKGSATVPPRLFKVGTVDAKTLCFLYFLSFIKQPLDYLTEHEIDI